MIENFLKLTNEEAIRARKLHGQIRSTHEGLGLLEEEFWEVKLEIFKKITNKNELLKELVQVAAICSRISEDCQLFDEEENKSMLNLGQSHDSSRATSGLELYDDPSARPIEDFLPVDELQDWKNRLAELGVKDS